MTMSLRGPVFSSILAFDFGFFFSLLLLRPLSFFSRLFFISLDLIYSFTSSRLNSKPCFGFSEASVKLSSNAFSKFFWSSMEPLYSSYLMTAYFDLYSFESSTSSGTIKSSLLLRLFLLMLANCSRVSCIFAGFSSFFGFDLPSSLLFKNESSFELFLGSFFPFFYFYCFSFSSSSSSLIPNCSN